MTKTRGPSNRKMKLLVYVTDVKPMEALNYDPRLPDPQIVFGGMVPVQVPGQSLLIDQKEQPQMMRPVYHAVFLVPTHLADLPEVMEVLRAMPQLVEVPDDEAAT